MYCVICMRVCVCVCVCSCFHVPGCACMSVCVCKILDVYNVIVLIFTGSILLLSLPFHCLVANKMAAIKKLLDKVIERGDLAPYIPYYFIQQGMME